MSDDLIDIYPLFCYSDSKSVSSIVIAYYRSIIIYMRSKDALESHLDAIH